MTTLEILQGIRDWVDAQLATKQDTINDLSDIRSSIADIEALMGTASGDSDTVINKVREMIDFFANIPETDTLSATLAQLNTAISDRYTKDETDEILESTPDFVEESDSAEGLQDEWGGLRNDVYQALTDAQTVTKQATTARSGADSAADFANSAATAANNAATNANDKATLADQAATAANNAAAAVEDAKGDFDTLDERLDYIEANAGDLEFVEDNTDNCPFG